MWLGYDGMRVSNRLPVPVPVPVPLGAREAQRAAVAEPLEHLRQVVEQGPVSIWRRNPMGNALSRADMGHEGYLDVQQTRKSRRSKASPHSCSHTTRKEEREMRTPIATTKAGAHQHLPGRPVSLAGIQPRTPSMSTLRTTIFSPARSPSSFHSHWACPRVRYPATHCLVPHGRDLAPWLPGLRHEHVAVCSVTSAVMRQSLAAGQWPQCWYVPVAVGL